MGRPVPTAQQQAAGRSRPRWETPRQTQREAFELMGKQTLGKKETWQTNLHHKVKVSGKNLKTICSAPGFIIKVTQPASLKAQSARDPALEQVGRAFLQLTLFSIHTAENIVLPFNEILIRNPLEIIQ